MFNDGSSTASTEMYLIFNYDPGNAKERLEREMAGKGTLYYKNGQKLIGNFEWDHIYGSAKLISSDGDILRSGTFKQTQYGLYFLEEAVKIGKISKRIFTAEGNFYFASNKIFIGTFKYSFGNLELVGEGQLIDGNGEKIEEGICSLKRFTNCDRKKDQSGFPIKDGVELRYGIYFGKETTGKVSGEIYLTNGKTFQGDFEIQNYDGTEYFNPTQGTFFSYDGTIIQEGKWKDGQFVG